MSVFTFEIVQGGRTPEVAQVLTLSDDRTIWVYVEALALRVRNRQGAFIRVKNVEGGTVIQAGLATVLTSIENCICVDCPLKRELSQCAGAGQYAATDFSPEIRCPLNA